MLEPIIAATRRRIEELARDRDRLAEAAAIAAPPPDLADALRAPRLSVIAEVKRRSPSAGLIAPDLDPEDLARSYHTGGAAAVSVLTEPDHFGGSLADLEAVCSAVPLPVLRKDFILDRLQVVEARAAGAAAVLLIAAVLADDELVGLLTDTSDLGMAALVEVHDRLELDRAVDAGAEVVGVNNRDLTTFTTDLGVAVRLGEHIPSGVVSVAESGIRNAADATAMRDAGFDAVLVGQALATAPDPRALLGRLTGERP